MQEGFWLPLSAQIAGLAEGDADDAADVLVQGSLLRVLDANRRRFQLHALLREELRDRAGIGGLAQLQERHALSLRGLFEDRESYWQGCVECLEEIIVAARFVAETGDDSTARQLSSWGYDVAETVGELDVAIRIMRDREAVCLRYGNRDGLGISYGNQALILWEWGQLDQAMALHKKEEGIYVETGNMDGLQASYGNQALILKDQGRLNEAMNLHKKEEAICRELGNKRDLAICFGNQAQILRVWQRLHEAMALHKEEEAICLEIGYRVGLQNSYEGQAAILRLWGRFDEALALLKKQEAICLEFSDRSSLGYCYWQWGLVARGQGDRVTETLKLLKALEIFTELRLHRPRTEVMAEIEKTKPTDGNNQS